MAHNVDVKTLLAEEITTQAHALALLKSLGKSTDPQDIIIRFARRELALAKDITRRASGKVARTVKLPTNLGKARPDLAKVFSSLAALRAEGKLTLAPARPAKAPRTAKAAPPASPKTAKGPRLLIPGRVVGRLAPAAS